MGGDKINALCLCEAPGSFAQCIYDNFNCDNLYVNSLIVSQRH